MPQRLVLLALLPLLCTCVRAQNLLPESYIQPATEMKVKLNRVLELDFRVKENKKNDYLASHLTLFSKGEKLELRVHLLPVTPNDPLGRMPHMRAHTMAMNLGSNDEDAVTTVHSFDGEELAALNATWARMYTFRPKRSYSERKHAQFIAIYREGQGLAYAILLFDKTPPTIEDRQLTLRFMEP